MNNRPTITNNTCKCHQKQKNTQTWGYRPPTDMLTSGIFMFFPHILSGVLVLGGHRLLPSSLPSLPPLVMRHTRHTLLITHRHLRFFQVHTLPPPRHLTHHLITLTTHYSLLITHHHQVGIHSHSLLTTHYSLLAAHHSLLAAHYSLLTSHHSRFTLCPNRIVA